ncbi:OmpA family protein [Melghirimyces algeriensis]|uniref:Chemotaxis protein MotB n=1 Tax=Melghirimyces algeriensis TaxID=910412 RepID=A0A521EI66_9BACL|nr:OmpA family protein [Melghirimyces algeriensis]SMO83617.1 chemotaxis protein MotB [Melghirimyces algeriensis]
MIRKRRQRRLHNNHGNGHKTWISYATLLAFLLLCFMFSIVIAVIVNSNTAIGFNNRAQEKETAQRQVEEENRVKNKIIKELITTFRKNDLHINLDEKTGDITFGGSIFFEKDSSNISDAGKKRLEDFFPTYIDVLLSGPFKNHVSAIIIEGHTDPTGSYQYNLDLSQDRASSVVRTIYSKEFPNFPQKDDLQKVLTANGRSYSDPIYIKGTKSIDAEKSRRVVFKFRLKDDELANYVNKLLGEKP